MYENFSFTYERSSNNARIGKLFTPHGIVDTPAFIFCGTKATVKAITPSQLLEANTQIILSNTYHLMLQPTADVVQQIGGLHKFMNWSGPIFTDSGGFQIFSLGYGNVASEIKGKREGLGYSNNSLRKITETGAKFKSYINGSEHLLTPESSIEIQAKLGADLVVVLDECTPYHVPKEYTERSMYMSHRWALRSLQKFKEIDDGRQALYGISQGGVYQDLRQISADFINENEFFAHAIGGSLGASKDQMRDIVSFTASKLRPDRPIHLLGIGGVSDIFAGVRDGIDSFDCVHPTRLARHGGALIKFVEQESSKAREHLNLQNHAYILDDKPLSPSCGCYCCRNFSRSYIHHLIKAKEILATTLLTIHNVYFMNMLMHDIRHAIQNNSLDQLERIYVKSS